MKVNELLVVKSTELGSSVLFWAAAKPRRSEVNREIKDSMLILQVYCDGMGIELN